MLTYVSGGMGLLYFENGKTFERRTKTIPTENTTQIQQKGRETELHETETLGNYCAEQTPTRENHGHEIHEGDREQTEGGTSKDRRTQRIPEVPTVLEILYECLAQSGKN